MIRSLKPYADLRDSGVPWLGDVPEHWDVLPARAVYRPKLRKNFGMPRKTVLSLSYGRIVVKPEEKLRGLVPESFETYQLVDPGDVIVRTTDLQNDRSSLRIGFSHHQGIITSAYMCLGVADRVLPGFGYQFLNAYDLLKVIYGFGSGLRQSLDFSDIKQMPVLVPPLGEQAAIVRFLDHADRRIRRYIAAKRKLIALLGEQKQAIIHRAVTLGLDPDASFKSSGSPWFPEIPEDWQILPLRRLIHRAVDGPHVSPEYVDEGVPFISARNVKADHWSLEDAKFISEADYSGFSRRVKPEPGDVLYTKGGTTGVARAVDLDFPFQVWVHVAVLKLNRQRVSPLFLAAALNSPRCYEQSQLFTRGATNQDLGLGRMKAIVVPVPPLWEQEAIIQHLEGATAGTFRAVQSAQHEIDLMREWRARLITDAVTGKLDVRDAAARLPDEAEEPGLLDDADVPADGDGSEDEGDPDGAAREIQG